MFEALADDHIAYGDGHEFLAEPLLTLLVREALPEEGFVVGQPYPGVGLQHFPHVLQFVVGGDLVQFVQFVLQGLLVEWGFGEVGQHRSRFPSWDYRNILHY
jgi:hypothetical protein